MRVIILLKTQFHMELMQIHKIIKEHICKYLMDLIKEITFKQRLKQKRSPCIK